MKHFFLLILIFSILSGASTTSNARQINANDDDRLQSKTWLWHHSTLKNGRTITPKKGDSFELTLLFNYLVSSTDCGSISSVYRQTGSSIKLSDAVYKTCTQKDKLHHFYIEQLENIKTYKIKDDGQLLLHTKRGLMTFK